MRQDANAARSEESAMQDAQQSEEMQRWIHSLAKRIKELKMGPAVELLLESHLPATSLVYSAGLMFQPLVSPFLGAERVQRFQDLFADRAQVELLLRLIREESAEV